MRTAIVFATLTSIVLAAVPAVASPPLVAADEAEKPSIVGNWKLNRDSEGLVTSIEPAVYTVEAADAQKDATTIRAWATFSVGYDSERRDLRWIVRANQSIFVPVSTDTSSGRVIGTQTKEGRPLRPINAGLDGESAFRLPDPQSFLKDNAMKKLQANGGGGGDMAALGFTYNPLSRAWDPPDGQGTTVIYNLTEMLTLSEFDPWHFERRLAASKTMTFAIGFERQKFIIAEFSVEGAAEAFRLLRRGH